MNATERFATAATAFQGWLLNGTDDGAAAARTALIHLLDLYRAGLDLPTFGVGEDAPDVEGVTDDEWRNALQATARLPVDLYGVVFNPLARDATDSVKGSIADDLADIYRDVIGGLRAYQKGDVAGAVWEWGFGLRAHWGAHATSAIHALHWWLTENDMDGLSGTLTPPASNK